MFITRNVHVELDPMQVPLAASMATGRDDRFDQVLQDTIAPEDERTAEPRRRERGDDAASETPVAPAPARDERDDELDEVPADDVAPQHTDDPAAMTADAQAVATASVTETIHRGEPVRQETAGKGADSPRSSSARPASSATEPLLMAVVQQKAFVPNAPLTAPERPAVAAVGATTATTGARGVQTAAARPNAPLQAPQVAASYRTSTAASAELLEHARDSVFKQILMQLRDDGGEMRMRLHPPELGELDLRLVVEDGNRVNLAIAADRTDVAQLLQRHLDELKHTLQQSGLQITGASVQTRSEFAREQRARDERPASGDAAAADVSFEGPAAPPRRGWVSASGLDFWA